METGFSKEHMSWLCEMHKSWRGLLTTPLLGMQCWGPEHVITVTIIICLLVSPFPISHS